MQQLMTGKLNPEMMTGLLGGDVIGEISKIFTASDEADEDPVPEKTPAKPHKTSKDITTGAQNKTKHDQTPLELEKEMIKANQKKKQQKRFNKEEQEEEDLELKTQKSSPEIAYTDECPKELLQTCKWQIMKSLYACIGTTNIKQCVAGNEMAKGCLPCQCLVTEKLC